MICRYRHRHSRAERVQWWALISKRRSQPLATPPPKSGETTTTGVSLFTYGTGLRGLTGHSERRRGMPVYPTWGSVRNLSRANGTRGLGRNELMASSAYENADIQRMQIHGQSAGSVARCREWCTQSVGGSCVIAIV